MKEVKQALYASKICSYAQGLNIIKAKSAEKQWDVDIGSMARIWKVRAAVMWCSVSDRVCLLHTAACASAVGDVLCCALHITAGCDPSSGHGITLCCMVVGLDLFLGRHRPSP